MGKSSACRAASTGFKEIQGQGWNHCILMPLRVELVLLGLPLRFGTNHLVLDYFL
jgi:hypothetical protein